MDEETIKAAFTAAFNSLINNKDEVIADYRAIIDRLTDSTGLGAENTALRSECEIVAGLMQKAITENACYPLNQDDYINRYNNCWQDTMPPEKGLMRMRLFALSERCALKNLRR